MEGSTRHVGEIERVGRELNAALSTIVAVGSPIGVTIQMENGSGIRQGGISQALGLAMRTAGVGAFRYPSARDLDGGINVGVFAPSAFGNSKPTSLQTWYCAASRQRVDITKGDYFKQATFGFPRAGFLVNGLLPRPAF